MIDSLGRSQAFRARLTQPVDAASLAVFRIAFGALLAEEAFGKYVDRASRYYHPDYFHFTFPGFHWVAPFPGLGSYIEAAVMGVAALGIMAGCYHRVCALVFTLAYAHLFLIEKALYNNHYYLIVLLGGFLFVTRPHASASLDYWRMPPDARGWVPFWHVAAFRAQFVLVYCYAGLAKLNGDWLRGEPMRRWLHNRADYPLVGPWFEQEWTTWFFSYGGLVFDLSVGFLLLWKRTRWFALVPFVFFHLSNHYLFSIGVFPWLALAGAVLFFPPDGPRRVLQRLGFALPDATVPMNNPAPVNRQRLVIALLALYFAVQLAFPLRHHLYAGNTMWHEAGQDFAWRMKLRDKRVEGTFLVRDADTGEEWIFDETLQRNALTGLQRRRMLMRPQMLLQYAHLLRDLHQDLGVARPEVYADVHVSLNGRPWQRFIDPTVNLAEIEYDYFQRPDWVIPLEPGLPIGEYPPWEPEDSVREGERKGEGERTREPR